MPLAGAVADARTTALALAAAALAAACFIGMDSTAKLLVERYGTTQVTFLRFATGALFAVPLWLWRRTPMPARPQWRWHALRSCLLLVALLTWFYALKQLPLVQAVGVGYTAPLFIALLAMWALHERPSRWIWAALAMGALGVCVALWPELSSTHLPGSDARLWGMAAASLSAVTYAGVVVVARHQAQHDALWTILLVQNLLPLLVLAVPMAWLWQPMPATDIPILLLMGALATGGTTSSTGSGGAPPRRGTFGGTWSARAAGGGSWAWWWAAHTWATCGATSPARGARCCTSARR